MPSLLLLLYPRASVRCVLQFDECFLLQCEKEGEAEKSLHISASRLQLLLLPAWLDTHPHVNRHTHVEDFPSKTHAYVLKSCTRRGVKCFSDPLLQGKAALQFGNMQPAC